MGLSGKVKITNPDIIPNNNAPLTLSITRTPSDDNVPLSSIPSSNASAKRYVICSHHYCSFFPPLMMIFFIQLCIELPPWEVTVILAPRLEVFQKYLLMLLNPLLPWRIARIRIILLFIAPEIRIPICMLLWKSIKVRWRVFISSNEKYTMAPNFERFSSL